MRPLHKSAIVQRLSIGLLTGPKFTTNKISLTPSIGGGVWATLSRPISLKLSLRHKSEGGCRTNAALDDGHFHAWNEAIECFSIRFRFCSAFCPLLSACTGFASAFVRNGTCRFWRCCPSFFTASVT